MININFLFSICSTIFFSINFQKTEATITSYPIGNEQTLIPYCSQYLNVATFSDKDNQNSIRICIKCQKMRVLTSDYKQCLHVREEIGNLKLAHCKRLNHLGQCAEALDGIEIIDNKFSYTNNYFQSNRCAVATKNYDSCISPRFGFILDMKEQKIFKDHQQYPIFCELYDSFLQKCIKYFTYFIPGSSNGLSIYLDNFINPHLVDSVVSNSQRIICIENNIYYSKGNINGCFYQELQFILYGNISNCKEYQAKNYICKQCHDGYVKHKNYQICTQTVIPKCTSIDVIDGVQICTKCQPFYRPRFFECIPLLHCAMLNPHNPNVCSACQSPYQLNLTTNSCEKTLSIIDNEQECKLFQENGICVLCHMNNLYYLSNNYCIQRQKSLFCKEFDPMNDSCLTLQCADDSFIVKIIRDSFSFNFEYPNIEEIILKHLIKYKIITQKSFSIICTQRQNYPIEGCKSYNPIAESCDECDEGYFAFRNTIKRVTKFRNLIESSNSGNFNAIYNQNYFSCSKTNSFKKTVIDKCLQYSRDGIYCIRCQPGYIENNSECIKGVDNCKVHQDINTCLECESGYISQVHKLNLQNIGYNRRCLKNHDFRINTSHIVIDPNNVIGSIVYQQKQCLNQIIGFVVVKEQDICMNDSLIPDCQSAIFIGDKLVCENCWYGYTLFRGKCYQSKLFPDLNNKKTTDITKNCMSLFNISLQQCEVTIPDNIIIIEESKFGESNEFPQFQFGKCKFKNCLICEIEQCFKCNQLYYLTERKECKKVCVEDHYDEECITQAQDQIDEDISSELPSSGNENNNTNENETNKRYLNNTFLTDILQIIITQFVVLIIILTLISLYRCIRIYRCSTNQNNYHKFQS